MKWLKKAYQDPGTRWITWALLVGAPVWSLLTYLVDSTTQWWAAGVSGWVFYLLVFIPMCYFHRNTP